MHLDGTHTLDAPLDQVWQALQDPDTLARVVPGIKELNPKGEDTYEALSQIKLGPVSGKFSGEMAVEDKRPPEHFVLRMTQDSKIGNVAAEGSIDLKAINDTQTEVKFAGDAKLSGTLARMGQRVLGGVAKSLTKQFFKNLEEELKEDEKEEVKE